MTIKNGDKSLSTLFSTPSLLTGEQVEGVKDNSRDGMQRALITFKNGHDISVIRGEFSYGGDAGLFEIMPSDSSVFENDHQDSVLGYLTPDQVSYYINKVSLLPQKAK